MSRRLRYSIGALAAIVLAACGSVSNKSPDAHMGDGPASIDANRPDSPAGAQSIVAVHRVIEMQRADQVVATSASFTTTSGRALILVAGSGQCASGFVIGMTIKLDGTSIGTSSTSTNELNSSKAFVRNALLVDLIAGNHTIAIAPLGATTMGASDFVDVTVIELGANASAATIFNNAPPPYSTTFTAGGGHGVMLTDGSGYVSAGAAILGMDVRVDNQTVGVLKTYSNEINSHKTLGADHMVLTPAAGSRTLSLVAQQGTNVDSNDHASAAWLEVGSDATPSQVIDHGAGPLPRSNVFVTTGHQILLFVSGSGYATTAGTVVEVAVKIDSVAIGSAKVATAEVASHKTLVPTVLLAQPAAGTHMLTLAGATGTNTDSNDFFNVTMIELGP